MANAITRLMTWLHGERVGDDPLGNVYYQDRKTTAGRRRRRWVIYSNPQDEASTVPPDMHAWLHYTVNTLPTGAEQMAKPWQKEHLPNLSGTDLAYRPPGHVLQGGRRDKATGDYEAWRPE